MVWHLTSPFHAGIVTADMDGTMAALAETFQLTWVPLGRPDVVHHTAKGPVRPSPRVSYSRQGPPYWEILETAPGTVYDLHAGTHLHHVGYWTDDFSEDLSAAQREGWSVEAVMKDASGNEITFAYLTRPGQLRVELVDAAQRSGLEALLSNPFPCAAGQGASSPISRGKPGREA